MHVTIACDFAVVMSSHSGTNGTVIEVAGRSSLSAGRPLRAAGIETEAFLKDTKRPQSDCLLLDLPTPSTPL